MMKKNVPGSEESVWDYPRPPIVEDVDERILVIFNNTEIARSERTKRVLETSHPPVYYLPPDDVKKEYLHPASGTTYCEWKGTADYFDLVVGDRKAAKAAWRYHEPEERFKPIADYLAFYANKMDSCYVDDEKVEPQAGGFYGGWITSNIVGPFKGQPGTSEW